MNEANWQEQTLQQYYPDYLSKKNFKLILKRFSSWHKRALKEERFSDALSRVKNLKSNNDTEDLIHHLLVVCFLAKHGNKFDDSKKIRNDWKDLGKNVETQKKLIRKLTRILKKSSEGPTGNSILVSKGNLYLLDNFLSFYADVYGKFFRTLEIFKLFRNFKKS